VREQYDDISSVYDERWDVYVRLTLKAFMRFVVAPLEELAPGARVLDVGTGTGAVPKALAERHLRLDLNGADVSEGMVEVARRECGACRFVVAPAEALPFEASSFAVITTLSSLHFWTDPAAGVREMHRVLAPGGQVIISDWCHDFMVCKCCSWYLWLMPGYSKADWSILGVCKVTDMLTAAGFVDVTVTTYKIDAHVFGRAWMPRWGMMSLSARK
jgi:ubiquinone/menaquinone biosynthesis C-methylase UbiE